MKAEEIEKKVEEIRLILADYELEDEDRELIDTLLSEIEREARKKE